MTELIAFLQALVLLGVTAIGIVLWRIKEHLGELNGTVGQLNTWKNAHDKQDERFYNEMRENVRDLWGKKVDKV